jgi:hypothetical protein
MKRYFIQDLGTGLYYFESPADRPNFSDLKKARPFNSEMEAEVWAEEIVKRLPAHRSSDFQSMYALVILPVFLVDADWK